MKQKTYLQTVAVIFTIICAAHLVRSIQGCTIIIGTTTLPVWVSYVGVLVAGFLAYIGFKLAGKR